MKMFVFFGMLLAVGGMIVGCGTIGPPIPPEEVGLAAKMIEQKEKARLAEGKPPKPAGAEEEDEVILPPVRPTGNAPGD